MRGTRKKQVKEQRRSHSAAVAAVYLVKLVWQLFEACRPESSAIATSGADCNVVHLEDYVGVGVAGYDTRYDA